MHFHTLKQCSHIWSNAKARQFVRIEFTVQCTFNRVLNIKYNIFEILENIRYQDTTYSKYEKSKSEYYSSVLLVLPVQCPANFVEYQISKANYKI